MSRPLACVIGDLSLVRALGRRGIPVAAVVSEPDSVLEYSRYVRTRVTTPGFLDDPQGAVSALVAWAKQQSSVPVLFYEGDHDLLALSRNRDALLPHFRLMLPQAELVEALVDKVRFSVLSEQLKLPVPATRVLIHGTDFSQEVRSWARFPAVIKPSMRTHWFGSHLQTSSVGTTQKALRVEDRGSLERLLPLLYEHETDIILQAAVEGPEQNILSYHGYVRPGGEIVAEFSGRKIRTRPRRYGLSTYIEITDDAEVKRLGRKVVERLNFSGVLKIDFKRDARDRQLYLLEINPRFNLWHHPATLAGVCLPELVYLDCLQPGSARIVRRIRPGVRWMHAQADMHAYLEHSAEDHLSAGRWLMQALSADIREDLMLRDPRPGLVNLANIVRRRFARLGQRHSMPFASSVEPNV